MANEEHTARTPREALSRFKWWLATDTAGRAVALLAAVLLTSVALFRPQVMDPVLWLALTLLWVGLACLALSEVIQRVG